MNDLYIHQLETENKQLREVLKSTNEVAKEYVRIEKHCDELGNRIDKAIEYINKNCVLSDEWTDLDFCNFIPTGKITYKQLTPKKVKNLLEILGGTNENNNI